MKKIFCLSCIILSVLFLFGCSNDSSTAVTIDPEVILGTWESENETERVSLTLSDNGDFEFTGYGNANEEEGISEVMLKETGTYTLEKSKLILSIKQVSSSGLDYGDFVSDEPGELKFYVTMSDDNSAMELIETNGNITYNLEKVN